MSVTNGQRVATMLHFVVHFVVPMGIFPMGNSDRFPKGKLAATDLTRINYEMYAGSLRVSVIHRTLTWTTGSITCVRDHAGVGHIDNE